MTRDGPGRAQGREVRTAPRAVAQVRVALPSAVVRPRVAADLRQRARVVAPDSRDRAMVVLVGRRVLAPAAEALVVPMIRLAVRDRVVVPAVSSVRPVVV